MTRIKICGLTNLEDALVAVALRVDAVATLGIDVVGEVTGERGDEFYLVDREKLGQLLLSRFKHDCKVGANLYGEILTA